MKKITIRLVSVTLILSVIFLQMPPAFADETVSPDPVVSTPVTTDPAPTPSTDPVTSPTDPVVTPIADPAPHSVTEPEVITTEQNPQTPPETSTTTIQTNNSGSTGNTVTTDASTGDNHITSGTATSTDSSATTTLSQNTGTSTIVTGNAEANSNVTNVLNTNIINSDASISVGNNLSNGNGNVDLRDLSGGLSSCSTCSVSTTTLTSNSNVNASTTNNGTISNVIIVRANTGDNTSSSTDALILTGDAYANANVINVANTNIIDSHYLLFVLNNLGNVNGDIVLPNADFFNQFLQASTTNSKSTNPLIVSSTNTSDIGTSVVTTADTGNNTASTTGDALVFTGDSHAGSTVFNDVNENHIGGNSVGIIFRIFGNWTGQTFNLPTGFSAQSTPNGIQFIYSSPNALSTSTYPTTNYSLQTANTASISNNVLVSAKTGNNGVEGDNALLATGDAYATANIVNIANTNVVSSNWLNAIINIFGDWKGNVSFGQPDLWVGTRADFKDGNTSAGAEVTFHYTIKNKGDAPAHSVVMTHDVASPLLTLDTSSTFDIGTLEPGEIKEFDQKAHVAGTLPAGYSFVPNTMSLHDVEPDGNSVDNTDSITLTVKGPITFVGPTNENQVLYGMTGPFTITKTNNAQGIIHASSTVDYTISIKNTGFNSVRHAMLHDDIKSFTGEVIHTEEWDLGEVDSQEEITVTYTAFFNQNTAPGTYTNNASVISVDNEFPNSVVAMSLVTIDHVPPIVYVAQPRGKVLGATIAYAATEEIPDAVIASSTDTTSTATLTSSAHVVQFIPMWFWLLLLIIIIGTYLSRRSGKMS